jgi:hypothetical protein
MELLLITLPLPLTKLVVSVHRHLLEGLGEVLLQILGIPLFQILELAEVAEAAPQLRLLVAVAGAQEDMLLH